MFQLALRPRRCRSGLRLARIVGEALSRAAAHIVLRGRDELGENMMISREYIARGMRERVAELVTLDLGPRQDAEIRQTLRRGIMAERLTSIDRKLIRDMNVGFWIRAAERTIRCPKPDQDLSEFLSRDPFGAQESLFPALGKSEPGIRQA